jgi:hypothetical protein
VISSRRPQTARQTLPVASPQRGILIDQLRAAGRAGGKEAAVANLVLQTVAGLVFIFATFAGAVSVSSEWMSRYLGLRGEYLLRGIRTAVDGPSKFELPVRQVMPWSGGRVRKKENEQKQNKNNNDGEQPGADDDEAMVSLIISHPLVASSAKGAQPPPGAGNRAMTNKERRRLPSYVSGQTFAKAVIDILVVQINTDPNDHNAGGGESRQAGHRDAHAHQDHREAQANPPQGDADQLTALRHWAGSPKPRHEHLAGVLRPLLAGAHDLKELEGSVAGWYEEQMARVSGWYKRHVRWISLGLALILVVAFNVNALKIADALYSDQAISTSVVAQATRASSCGSTNPATCLSDLHTEVGKLRGTSLPIGWGNIPACTNRRPPCSWFDEHGFTSITANGSADTWAFLLMLLGWAVMIVAMLPGARFWFDLLSKFGTLRSTGPKPST